MRHLAAIFFLAVLLCGPSSFATGQAITRWLSQELYVPLYSHIYGDDRYKDKPILLTGTLFIRNTDPKETLIVTGADYYDADGKKLRGLVDRAVTVAPLATVRYIIPEGDKEGGSGAKFLVRWHSTTGISEPIIESVMIGTRLHQGISFTSRGLVISGTTTALP